MFSLKYTLLSFALLLCVNTHAQYEQYTFSRIDVSSGLSNKVGQQYFDFPAATLNGDSTRVSQLMKSNRYTLLQFWASWCVPCRKEIPLLKKMFAEHTGKGFGIIAFSLDDNKIAWTKASEKEQFNWPNISDLKAFSSVIVKEYKISGIPANVIIDQNGKIVANNLVGDDLEKKIRELFQ